MKILTVVFAATLMLLIGCTPDSRLDKSRVRVRQVDAPMVQGVLFEESSTSEERAETLLWVERYLTQQNPVTLLWERLDIQLFATTDPSWKTDTSMIAVYEGDDPLGEGTGGRAITDFDNLHDVYNVGGGLGVFKSSIRVKEPFYVARFVLHEMCHSFGLRHNNYSEVLTIMHPNGGWHFSEDSWNYLSSKFGVTIVDQPVLVIPEEEGGAVIGGFEDDFVGSVLGSDTGLFTPGILPQGVK